MELTILIYIMVFLFGITVGSFLNVCILRIPKGESIVTVPSHCMSCGKRLRWFELIPLFSWLFLRGRCSGCGTRISAQYPIIEAANGLLWVLIFLVRGICIDALLACLMASALLVLSVIDARTREIPPGTTILILVLGVVRVLLDISGWGGHAIGFFAISVPLLILYILTGGGAIGEGDIKLMAVCGLFLGWKCVVLAFFAACIIGSVIHLSLMAAKKAGRVLSMGPYLAAGVLLSYLWGEAAIGWYISLF